MSKTIIIVDDHILFAQSLQGLVNSFEDFSVLAVMKNGQELVDYLQSGKTKPDVILLDIRMPVLNGMETMAWLKESEPDQPVLALSMEHDEHIILKMIRLGCRGYLLKDIDPNEFSKALNAVVNSGYYFNSEVSEALNNEHEQREVESLTKREMEFLQHACSELTYKEVANEMNLSPKTIDGYRESIFHKLEVKSRVGLVLFAIKNQMVDI
ncbi:response regulator transcription factor [Gillisia sp. M10.2A]|uniref:Response regulator transcription factor n=1 Tax=Gillisia lutea TaxID=2909668 RepID=A0ABS9EIH4_9FLAO|nr:response regulator transcription factor [Gillisia lutea]MCF4102583.1 response regulator transcription factor [Gillisia lutea]